MQTQRLLILIPDTKTTDTTLAASKDTPYASVAKVLDACKAADRNTVSLESTPSKETTKSVRRKQSGRNA